MKRQVFLKLRERYRRRGSRFVYIDESGFEPEVHRCYGYAPIGRIIHGETSGHKRPRTSFLAARMPDGSLQATQLWNGTCNTQIFNEWLEKQFLPFLQEDHVVIMDNATFHKSLKTKQLIEEQGATLLFLPPYSPDLNPIEHDFANIKKLRQFNHEKSIDDIINDYQ